MPHPTLLRALLCAALLLVAGSPVASPPNLINYQGILTDSDGTPISGLHELTFTIHSDSGASWPVWTEVHPQVQVQDGLFNVILGGINAFPGYAFSGESRWMGITVDDDPEISPRMRMTSVPWAIRAAVADSAIVASTESDGDWIISGDDLSLGVTGNVGIGTANPLEKLELLGGRIALRRPDSSEQWLELRDDNFLGARIVGHSPEAGKKAISIQAVHDGTGSPSGETWIRFSVGLEDDPLHVLSIKESGNVGIGTVEPTRNVEIVDEGRAYLRLTSGEDRSSSTLELKGRDVGAHSRFGSIDFLDQNDEVQGTISYGTSGFPYVSSHFTIDPGDGDPVYIEDSGNVGIGVQQPGEKLQVDGTVMCKVLKITAGADLAEPFDVSGDADIEPGMVVAIDRANPGQLKISDRGYDRCVAGVVSGAGGIDAGLLMGHSCTEADGSYPIALTGRVYCLATAANGSIEPGDLLTTSDIPGHAMKVTEPSRAVGAIIGKAMTALPNGQGLVLALVGLQ